MHVCYDVIPTQSFRQHVRQHSVNNIIVVCNIKTTRGIYGRRMTMEKKKKKKMVEKLRKYRVHNDIVVLISF